MQGTAQRSVSAAGAKRPEKAPSRHHECRFWAPVDEARNAGWLQTGVSRVLHN